MSSTTPCTRLRKLTWLSKFLGDSPRLSSVSRGLLCSILVCLVLDSVLFKVWVAQILFQRVDEGHRCLLLQVRRELG